jgi:hypothetical protein
MNYVTAGKRMGRPPGPGKGNYRRQQPGPDIRSVLAMLPGRLLAKHHVDRELREIRDLIATGERRELIALLPGLELEAQRLNEDLGTMATMMDGTGAGVVPVRSTPQINYAGPKALVAPEAKTARASMTAEEAVPHLTGPNGKVSIVVAALHWFREHANVLDAAAFKKRWEKTYLLPNRTMLHQALVRIRDVNRLDIRHEKLSNEYTLHTEVTGDLPPLPGKDGRPVRGRGRPAGKVKKLPAKRKPTEKQLETMRANAAKARAAKMAGYPGKKPKVPVAAEVAAEAAVSLSDVATRAGARPAGTQNEILAAEFRAAPDHVLDLKALAEKYGTGRYAFNFVMKKLAGKGWKFERVTTYGKPGMFQMVREGKTT